MGGHAASGRIAKWPSVGFYDISTTRLARPCYVLIIAAYWYAWRPLPDTSGVVEATVAGRAVVSRDALGVPHIMAASLPDALFVQGYVTAQDRLFQMDALRRMAAGELAEVVGPAGLAGDREARQLRLRRIAEAYNTGLPPQDRAALAAYARGVNQFILTHRGRLAARIHPARL